MICRKALFLITIPLLFSLLSCSNNSKTQGKAQVADKNPKAQARANTDPSRKIDSVKAANFTNEAKFLAGMKVDTNSSLASLEKNDLTWQNHATYLDNGWARLEKQELIPIKQWSAKEIKPVVQSDKFVFYPFSGPDFLYAYSFFPQGYTYVLAGLEPIGSLPALEKMSTSEVNRSLLNIEQSLGALLNYSFFRTNDMKVDLSQQGVLPILFVFLARTHNQIQDVQYVALGKDGKVQQLGKNQGNLLHGVKIDFVPEGNRLTRSLYYFSGDLSDSGLKKTPEFTKFVQNQGKTVSYLKAASYLLHYNDFSMIRNLILTQSNALLQDDSGIPLKYFNRQDWQLQFYGNYTAPIALFSNEYQPDLSKEYQNKANVKPLNFGIGYRYQVSDSNLMLAIKKK